MCLQMELSLFTLPPMLSKQAASSGPPIPGRPRKKGCPLRMAQRRHAESLSSERSAPHGRQPPAVVGAGMYEHASSCSGDGIDHRRIMC